MNQTIEQRLSGVLKEDLLTNALDFVKYLQDIGWTYDNDGRFYYKEQMTCIVIFFPVDDDPRGLWVICDAPNREYDGYEMSEELKTFARANVMICHGGCGCPDAPRGGDRTIYGQEYKGVCSSDIQFINPDAEALINVKKLMDMWTWVIDRHTAG